MHCATNITINIHPPSDEESKEEEMHQKKVSKQRQEKNHNKEPADAKNFKLKSLYRQHRRLQRVNAVEKENYVNDTLLGDELSVSLHPKPKAKWPNSASPTLLTNSIKNTSLYRPSEKTNQMDYPGYESKTALEKFELNDPRRDINYAEAHQNSKNETMMSVQQVDGKTNCENLESAHGNFNDRSNTQERTFSRWRTLKHAITATARSRKSANDFLDRFDTQSSTLVKSASFDVENEQSVKKEINRFSTLYNCCLAKFKPLQPDGSFIFCWLLFVSLATEYDMWIQPMRAGFPGIQDYYGTVWSILDRVADVIYYCDFVVQFRTGFLEHGVLVTSQDSMTWHYVKSKYFWIDLLALLPTDLLFIGIGVQPLVRSFKFLKLYRIVQCYRMAVTRISFPNVLRMANLIHILLLLCHLLSIAHFQISHWPSDEQDQFTKHTNTTALTTRYLVSFHWAMLTITTIGDLSIPKTNALYVFQIVSYLIGIFVFAYIMGQVGNVINNNNSSRQQYERSLDDAKLFMKRHNVPKDLQSKVQKWYNYSWTKGRIHVNDGISSLAILPERLQSLIAIHVNLDILRKVSIFENCEPQFLHDILLKMTSTMCNPGDLLVKRGEIAQEMFIIADGKLEVLNDDGDIIATLESGDFIGEIGIINLEGVINRRTADVRSVGFTELFVLKRDVILRAMRFYPDAKASLIKHATHRLHELQQSQLIETQDDTNVERNLSEREDKLCRTSGIKIPAKMSTLRATASSDYSINYQDLERKVNQVNDIVKNLQRELQQKDDLIQVLEAQLHELN